jgi:polyferredoxin
MRAMTTRIKRRIVQLIAALGINWYLFWPWLGNRTRSFCVPVLNCWTCPAAAFSCPIGAIGTSFANHIFPYFALGLVLLFGVIAGRFWCGWICPFGTLQDYMYKIPTFKLRVPGFLTYLRYGFLAGTVFLVPYLANTTEHNLFWCQFCPAGRIEAGIYAKFVTPAWPEIWRFLVIVGFVLFMIVSQRGFCRVFCPLGAIFGLCNKISLWRITLSGENCKTCGQCRRICPVNHSIHESPDSPDCIKCLDCKTCKFGAVSHGISLPGKKPVIPENKPEA